MNAKKVFSRSTKDHAVVLLRVNLIHNSVDRVLVLYELKRKTIKRFNSKFNSIIIFFFYTHLGYSLTFIAVCHCLVMGGIPLLSRGYSGKNRSKTTVGSKGVSP